MPRGGEMPDLCHRLVGMPSSEDFEAHPARGRIGSQIERDGPGLERLGKFQHQRVVPAEPHAGVKITIDQSGIEAFEPILERFLLARRGRKRQHHGVPIKAFLGVGLEQVGFPMVPGPATVVSVQTSCFMELGRLIHGPPLLDQPGPLCMPSCRPRRSASFAAKAMSALPCRAQVIHRPARDVDAALEDDCAAEADLLHRFQIAGDAGPR